MLQHVVIAVDPLLFSQRLRIGELLSGYLAELGLDRGAACGQRLDIGLALGPDRFERSVGGIGLSGRTAFRGRCLLQHVDLVARGNHVGMVFGQAAGPQAGKLGLGIAKRATGTAGGGSGQGLGRTGQLAIDSGKCALRGRQIGIDPAQFGAQRFNPLDR